MLKKSIGWQSHPKVLENTATGTYKISDSEEVIHRECERKSECQICRLRVNASESPDAYQVKRENTKFLEKSKRRKLYDLMKTQARLLKKRTSYLSNDLTNDPILTDDPHKWKDFSNRIGVDWCLNILDMESTYGIHYPFMHISYVLLCPVLLPNQFCDRATLDKFIINLNSCYNEVPYHNSTHGGNVGHLTSCVIKMSQIDSVLSLKHYITAIVSALGHDAGHLGRSARWMKSIGDPITIIYGTSPLEHYHTFLTLNSMSSEDSNILKTLDRKNYNEFRLLVLKNILATDMTFHKTYLDDFKSRLENEDRGYYPIADENDRAHFIRMIIKLADIGHAALPWDQHYEWSRRALTEFYQEGDELRHLGVPVFPTCARNLHPTYYTGQSQFIKFCVSELAYRVNTVVTRCAYVARAKALIDKQNLKIGDLDDELLMDEEKTATQQKLRKILSQKLEEIKNESQPDSNSNNRFEWSEDIATMDHEELRSESYRNIIWNLRSNVKHWAIVGEFVNNCVENQQKCQYDTDLHRDENLAPFINIKRNTTL